MVSPYVSTYVRFPAKQDVFQNHRIVLPRKQDACTDAVRTFKISHLVLEIGGKIENGQSTRKYVFPISRKTGNVFQN